MFFYLTATYRRSPRFGELALPLIPGLPLLAVGGLGVAASYGVFGTEWVTGDLLFRLFATMAGIGGMVSLGSVLAILGELVNRTKFRESDEQEDPSARAEDYPFATLETPEPGEAVARRRAAAGLPSWMPAGGPCRKPQS